MSKSSNRTRGIARVNRDLSDDEREAPSLKKRKGKTDPTEESAEQDQIWELSSGRQPRRVEISEFKGTKLVNIREFYEKDGDFLPGKKGISLTVDQYKAFVRAVPSINAQLKAQGVPLEDLSSGEGDEDNTERDAKKKSKKNDKTKKKSSKENIEATSDEDEDEE